MPMPTECRTKKFILFTHYHIGSGHEIFKLNKLLYGITRLMQDLPEQCDVQVISLGVVKFSSRRRRICLLCTRHGLFFIGSIV